MLADLIRNGFGEAEDFNCAEKILYGANEAYKLGLSKDALRMSSGFGGGMALEDKCGALTAGIMVLGLLFVRNNAHESTRIKDLELELFNTYKREMGHIDCKPLKENYRTEELKCKNVIVRAAGVLDGIIERELK